MSSELLAFQLPVPPAYLSPNSRCHWSKKAKEVKTAREAAQIEALRVLNGRTAPRFTKARFSAILFHLTKRTPDPDNFIAMLKPYLDGLADAGIVANDRDLWPERPIFLQCNRLPHVRLTVTPE